MSNHQPIRKLPTMAQTAVRNRSRLRELTPPRSLPCSVTAGRLEEIERKCKNCSERLDTLEHEMELLRNAFYAFQAQLPSGRQHQQYQQALPQPDAHTFTPLDASYGLWSSPGPDSPVVVDSHSGLQPGLGLWGASGGGIGSGAAISGDNSPLVFGSDSERALFGQEQQHPAAKVVYK